MNIIYGASGVGKTTLLREYLIQHFSSYVYVNQKLMVGNTHSTVCTDLGISGKISLLFSKKYRLDKTDFLNTPSARGACRTCNGSGIITYGVPEEMKTECRKRLPDDMLAVLDAFEKRLETKRHAAAADPFLDGNELIEAAIT